MRMLMCMCMLNKRVHVLFDKDLWKKLTKSAKAQNLSAGELIRRAVLGQLEKKKEEVSPKQGMHFKGLFKSKS